MKGQGVGNDSAGFGVCDLAHVEKGAGDEFGHVIRHIRTPEIRQLGVVRRTRVFISPGIVFVPEIADPRSIPISSPARLSAAGVRRRGCSD
jgi:hypothetical protein